MFEVGKKYTMACNGSIYECLSVLSDGQSLLRNIGTNKHHLTSSFVHYQEYKEPRKLVINIWIIEGEVFASTTNAKYHGTLLDTIEWVEKV